MKNKRNITIKVIQNDNINSRRLAKYFAEKYCEKVKNRINKKS